MSHDLVLQQSFPRVKDPALKYGPGKLVIELSGPGYRARMCYVHSTNFRGLPQSKIYDAVVLPIVSQYIPTLEVVQKAGPQQCPLPYFYRIDRKS